MKKVCTLLLLCVFVLTVAACKSVDETSKEKEATTDAIGYYEGEIDIPNQPLGLEVTLQKKDGELSGTMSIPMQGLSDYPLSTVEQKGENELLFTMKIQNQIISFEGKIDSDQIAGTFKQNNQAFPFQLTKAKKAIDAEGEFLQVETAYGTLSAEVKLPEGKGPYPVLLIIPGSGQTDRDGNTVGMAGKNNSLKLLADGLAEQGIATIRYDKRGVKKNSQAITKEEDMRLEQFVDDAVAFIDKLKTDDRFSTIGIIGHSQGSLVGMLAAQEQDIDAYISLAGLGRSIDQGLYDQLREQLPKKLLKESQDILKSLTERKTVDEVSTELQAVFRPSVQPFLISWMTYEPAAVIADVKAPTLIVQGEHDLQVSAKEADLLYEAAADAELLILEQMNHVLKDAPKDREQNLATYTNPDLPLAKGLLEGIGDFLAQNGFVK
ncbi:alpha/beta hydrolase family protein [Virgibacillus pantothenticus]|uniref:alpha/beta hydrolase family protein n=1 Tax=Virgibacillus pantothenticus TaxID=1473 RepID=UPI000985E12B|nr:alpha/beta fold hydrolase [Virgibacillus pantothenticus]